MNADFWLGVFVGAVGLVIVSFTLVGAMHLLDLLSSGSPTTDDARPDVVVPLQRVGR